MSSRAPQRTSAWLLVACTTTILGCRGDDQAAVPTQADGTSLGGGDAGTTTTGAATEGTATTSRVSTSSAEETTTEPFPPSPVKFDLGALPDAAEIDTGCQAVDFLFVIDNSFSMDGYQTNLVNNFPTFIDGITSTLTDVDSYHVGVVTTDAYSYNAEGCQLLGALVTQTGGSSSSNAQCTPYAEGHSFMTEQDDLAEKFACAARVGTGGSASERPMAALEQAVGGQLACNDGFLRDEALLVVIMITDEAGDSAPSQNGGTPESWHASVVAAKNDIPENVVVVSLVQWPGSSCSGQTSTSDGSNIVAFTEMFGENGFVDEICTPDYGPVFAQATGVIATACDNFVTPG